MGSLSCSPPLCLLQQGKSRCVNVVREPAAATTKAPEHSSGPCHRRDLHRRLALSFAFPIPSESGSTGCRPRRTRLHWRWPRQSALVGKDLWRFSLACCVIAGSEEPVVVANVHHGVAPANFVVDDEVGDVVDNSCAESGAERRALHGVKAVKGSDLPRLGRVERDGARALCA